MLLAWVLAATTTALTLRNAQTLFRLRRRAKAFSSSSLSSLGTAEDTGSSVFFEDRYNVVVFAVCCAGPAYVALAAGEWRTVFACAVSLLAAALWAVAVSAPLRPRKRSQLVAVAARVGLTLAQGGALAAFFFATSAVIGARPRTLRDAALLRFDEALLGWAFPRGQFALWLDGNDAIGPHTPLGAVLTDFLTLWYISYYIWPYMLLAALLLRCLWTERRAGPSAEAAAWRDVERFMSAWVTSFGLTFLINTLCPAVSPRVYLRNEFVHPLDGFGLRTLIGGIIHQDDSYGSFPSGHVGETLAVGLAALRIGATPRFGKFVMIAGAMVSIATMSLRYHYFADLLAAIFVALISVAVTFYRSPRVSPLVLPLGSLQLKAASELEPVTVVVVSPPPSSAWPSNSTPLLSRTPRPTTPHLESDTA